MTTRTKISNCPVRISAVAEPLGFKTIGAFYKFLKQCKPATKLYYGISHIRVLNMRKLVEVELGINPYQHSSEGV